jgi:hypothetical protein
MGVNPAAHVSDDDGIRVNGGRKNSMRRIKAMLSFWLLSTSLLVIITVSTA